MSRIGKMPISIPSGVDVRIDGNTISVKGPKGELSLDFNEVISFEISESELIVKRADDEANSRAFHGLTRTLVYNMVVGVTEGFSKKLELVGVGYRAAVKGGNLEMSLGYSHPVVVEAVDGITFECPSPTEIVVSGIDKQKVGQVTADIRKWRAPEPYKGKGIRYEGEQVRRKLGKAASVSS